MKFLEKAEDLQRRLSPDDAAIVEKLISEVRLGRSQNRKLRRNKRSLHERLESAGEENKPSAID